MAGRFLDVHPLCHELGGLGGRKIDLQGWNARPDRLVRVLSDTGGVPNSDGEPMLSAADNEVLTQTGPATPMGRYFRRRERFGDEVGRVGPARPAGRHRGVDHSMKRMSEP